MTWFGVMALLAAAPAQSPPAAPVAVSVPFTCQPASIAAAGLDCPSEAPCAVYLELNGIDSSAEALAAAGDLHTETATLESILILSFDGGRTWTEPYERMPVTTLDHVQFADPSHGWVSGWSGNSLPRDPFLLSTADGGKSWKKLPISADIDTGAIARFRFDSPNVGALLLDTAGGAHHQLFQTIDGGESWELERESDRAIDLPRASSPPPDPVWRVRADAATKSYAIEHNTGSVWSEAARLSIAAGSCSQ